MHTPNPRSLFVAILVCCSLAAGSATALTTGQDIVVIGAPSSVVEGALEGSDTIYLFKESTGLLTGGGLAVDITTPGVYTGAGSHTNSMITGPYESWMLHYDPVGTNGGVVQAVGEVSFDFDIIGIIIDRTELDSSDPIVGNPGTAYPTGMTSRGLEGGAFTDIIEWEISLTGPRTLDVNILTSGGGIDQIRVITKTPEPGTYALMGMFLMFAAYASRRKQATA